MNKQIKISETSAEVMEKLNMLKRKYGQNTAISDIADDPFLWIEN